MCAEKFIFLIMFFSFGATASDFARDAAVHGHKAVLSTESDQDIHQAPPGFPCLLPSQLKPFGQTINDDAVHAAPCTRS